MANQSQAMKIQKNSGYFCRPTKSRIQLNTIMKYYYFYIFMILYLICGTLSSCTSPRYWQLPEYQQTLQDTPIYKNLEYWAAHPWKHDPSDSTPKPLRKLFTDSIADVFFVHPTSFTNLYDTAWNAALNDPLLNAQTDYSSILYQASAFNEQTRIFSPRYRQANLKVYFSKDTFRSREALQIAYEDVKKAFDYYLTNWNQGRPIIIAAHSQGTQHAARLLKEYFDGKPLQRQLVSAYLIGMPVPQLYFSSLKACNESGATGCVISWRTFKRGYTDPLFVAKEKFQAIVINPLNWKTDITFIITRNENTGAVLRNFNKIKKGVVDAQIHQNVLWTSRPKFFGSFLIRQKNYHVGDINLFYLNIRTNIHAQIQNYLTTHTAY